MSSSLATSSAQTTFAGEPLSQLTPFNEVRFRQCMAYLAHVKGRPLSQLYLVKFNVLIDLFHVLRCGKPVIGGSVAPWELGPVVPQAYRLCTEWRAAFDEFGRHPDGFRVVGRAAGGKLKVKAAGAVDADDFSRYEIEAMEQAWGEIGHLNYPGLWHYAHSPDTFLGHAWTTARGQNRLMDWGEIIDAWDRFRDEDHAAVKALIRF